MFIKPLSELSAKTISKISIFLWFLALILPALKCNDIRFGYELFFIGWLGPLDILAVGYTGSLNIAWYSNLFYFFVISAILFPTTNRNLTYKKNAIIAVIIASTLFFIARITTNEGGGSCAVYGYGIGAVLWLISIYLVLIAASIKLKEDNVNSNSNTNEIADNMKFIGLALITILIIASIFFSIYERVVGNVHEKENLSGILFKRSFVCTNKDPIIEKSINLNNGVLEIINPNEIEPFNQVRKLLEWGIPIVRMDGLDYRFQQIGDEIIMTARPSSGLATGRLIIISKSKESDIHIQLQVLSPKLQSIIDFTWHKKFNGEGYCPDYNTYPSISDEPRKSIITALNLQEKIIPDNSQNDKGNNSHLIPYSVKTIPNHSSAPTLSNKTDLYSLSVSHKGLILENDAYLSNGIYYFQKYYPAKKRIYKNNTAIYFITYLTRVSNSSIKGYFTIDKRSAKTFKREWINSVQIEDSNISIPEENEIVINEIDDNESEILLNFFDMTKSNIINVKIKKTILKNINQNINAKNSVPL